MTLEEAIRDYQNRQYKKFRRFRKCSNCKFVCINSYHSWCKVKGKVVEYEIEALVCRYYTKI